MFYVSGNADITELPNIVSKLCLTLSSDLNANNIQNHTPYNYRQNEENLYPDYRFFDQFLCLKYRLLNLFFSILSHRKRIISTAPSAMKTMRFKSLKKQYSILNILVLNHNQHKS